MRPNQKVEVFPDGIVKIYEENGRKVGKLKGVLHFENQSVGVNRYYQSLESVAGSRIDRVIKVLNVNFIDRLNIAVITSEGDIQYRINRIQVKPERNVALLELQSVPVKLREQ